MVAIRFSTPDEAAEGYMILARAGTVRTFRGEIYVCKESALSSLDSQNLHYEKVPLPASLNDVDALRDTPTTAL
ncbi:MAG TPA: hypothetical protein VKV95_05930 [Terriglobia bacterium]|nr:hypothetical protein [Terriglobia bacterium]